MAGRLASRIYRTARWKRVRVAVLDRDGYRCRGCGRAAELQVHHSYPIWKYPARDHYDLATLRALCRSCHFQEHRADAIPPDRAELLRYVADYVAGSNLHA